MPQAIDLKLFAGVFAAIFVAELPDKTALATLLLASRRRAGAVFVGTAAAFVIQSAIAVAFGQLFSLLPGRWIRAGAGLLFLAFAVAMWRRRPEEGRRDDAPRGGGFWSTALVSFGVIFAAEWGDLTQLATAAFAARYRAPLTIFAAATSALWCVTALAVGAGARLGRSFEPRALEKLAAALFAAVGLWLLVRG
jgi:putative Ca2+/H+ antiporter (TMEM165/GDT1 family)